MQAAIDISTLHDRDELAVIKRAYRKVRNSIRHLMDDKDERDMDLALEIAIDAHHDQRRKSGEPYILHPIEVARICVDEIGLGPTAIVAAILHDVVEDSDYTSEQIHEMFGAKIGSIVDGLTKLKGLYDVGSMQAENFKRVLSSLVQDVRVVLIKMADRLHNLRTAGAMPREKQLKIASETMYIYAPLAHRLGLYSFKTEYEDLCMKLTDRDTYSMVAKKLQETKRARNKYIKEFITPLSEQIGELDVPFRIFGRPKSIFSISNKIKKKKVPFEEIYDLFAIRIVVDVPVEKEKSICWQVYSIVTDVHQPIPERLKDWVTTPKSNGYESLHTTVIGPQGRFVEVQIRSERMDQIAERGFAAHWKYKGLKKMNVYDIWLDNVREMMDSPGSSTNTMEFVSDFKTNLWAEEVFVYTPKGDLKILPKGATALDFAFAIHSDIGYHCTGVKVNNKIVPMGYKLSHGDQVSVLTNKSQKPNESWLKSVVTGKARSKIRSSLKEEKRKQGELAKENLMRKFKNLKIGFEDNIDTVVQHFGFESRPELYFALATGKLTINLKEEFTVVNNRLTPPEKKKVEKTEEVKRPRKSSNQKQPKIFINGEPGNVYEYALATCCNPVKGDSIFGYTSLKSGLKIHRFTCPNATHLLANYATRVVPVNWASDIGSSFTVDLVINGMDDGPGVVERISNKISSQLGINIRSFQIKGDEGYFEGRVGIIVNNVNQLNMVINELKKMENISSVTRIN